jgi:predicted phosphodiesterase
MTEGGTEAKQPGSQFTKPDQRCDKDGSGPSSARKAIAMNVGTRVHVAERGVGVLAHDNDNGTWNVELDDGNEGDFAGELLTPCSDQSREALQQASTPPIDRGIRVVSDPTEPKPSGWTRFVCFSDTHGLHDEVPAAHRPPADVLLHAGDFTNTGELEQVESLARWLREYPAAHKVVIAGNHDVTFHSEYYVDRGGWQRFHPAPLDCSRARPLLADACTYLEDEATEVSGYTIYGSPWQPAFCDWAFNLRRGAECARQWALIPESVDILMTHGPPHGRGDQTARARVGCEDLRRALEQRAISVSLCGHVHEGYGHSADNVTLYLNASTCTRDYRPSNPPLLFDAPPPAELRAATAAAAAARRARTQQPPTADARAVLDGLIASMV